MKCRCPNNPQWSRNSASVLEPSPKRRPIELKLYNFMQLMGNELRDKLLDILIHEVWNFHADLIKCLNRYFHYDFTTMDRIVEPRFESNMAAE